MAQASVLIVGGGLAGLSTATYLALNGVHPLLVERHPGTSIQPRATGQTPRTMEILGVAGLADQVRAASGARGGRLRIVITDSVGGHEFQSLLLDGEPDTGDFSPAGWGMTTQEQLEPLLRERAERLGAQLRFNTELVSFAADADGVAAVIADRASGAQETVGAGYLVAADGHRGSIRERSGIGAHGAGRLACYVTIVFSAALEVPVDRTVLYYLQHPQFTGAFGSTYVPDRHVLAVQYRPEQGEQVTDFDERRCVELIRLATNQPELPPEILDILPWELAARVADRFRHGRVLLAGDAAHVTPPTGGLGGNLAVQDGFDLGWKLAAVLKGVAGEGLLDSYDAERRPAAELVVGQSLRNYVTRQAPHLNGRIELPAEVDHMALIFGTRCASTAVLAEDEASPALLDPAELDGRPGYRAPHLPLRRDGAMRSTIDLFGRGWVLLVGTEGGAWEDAAAEAAAGSGVELAAYRIDAEVAEVEDAFTTRYGVGPGGASLVRPDGIVAWRSPGAVEDPASVLSNVLNRLLSRSTPG